MTQPGETDDYNLMDHIKAILSHSREDLLDYVIGNIEDIPKDTLNKYITDFAIPVKCNSEDYNILKKKNIHLITRNLIDVKKDYIRHDNIELSKLLIEIATQK